jgi:cytochrome c peroxidase
MKITTGILGICFCLVVMVSLTTPSRPAIGVEPAVAFFRIQASHFANSTRRLQTALAAIEEHKPTSVLQAREALKQCKVNYKKIEYFLAYFFNSSSLIYNAPPKPEIEEPFMEYEEPIGLQVIEAWLYEKEPATRKEEILQQVEVINSSAHDLHALLHNFQADDRQLLESIRLELIRVITMGITGFDAPLLKSGITEAAASMEAVRQIMRAYLSHGAPQSDSVSKYLESSRLFLQQHPDFDTFDRMTFLTQHILPLQQHIGLLVKALNLEYNTTGGALNHEAANLFSPGALNILAFPHVGDRPDTALQTLGKKLFFEPGLSGNNKISCATCHNPTLHFTDTLTTSITFDGHSHVRRNAATLLYAGFQYEQFWDGRAKNIEEQIREVMINPHEMNGGEAAIQSLLHRKPEYIKLLKTAFPHPHDTTAVMDQIAHSIAAWVRSLNPRNARFDKYMQGAYTVLTTQEIRGFNLFMGKAQCGTCHFAPLFNGLVPPLYNRIELEVLGTTQTDNLDKPVLDTDRGRYDIFQIRHYERAFKTPTVRNVSATGPYMHNGAFKTLEAVVEFYNKGGANGLGLNAASQTLSALPLNLSKEEVNDIVQFLHALEDSVGKYANDTITNTKQNNR